MNLKIIFLIIASLLISFIQGQKPVPLWPQYMTITQVLSPDYINGPDSEFSLTITQWISFETNQSKQQFHTGTEWTQCYRIFHKSDKCVHLTTNQTFYVIMPDSALCCFYSGGGRYLSRDYLRQLNMTYRGTMSLNDGIFDMWKRDDGHNKTYCATTDQRQIPRLLIENYVRTDYFVNSYSDKPIDQSIFSIPNYCTQSCPRDHLNSQRKHTFGFMSMFTE